VTELDTEALKRIIQNVEESIDAQGIDMASSQKAKLIASLYEQSRSEGKVPGKMTTDQAVWMAH
jgi:hypothetical protein